MQSDQLLSNAEIVPMTVSDPGQSIKQGAIHIRDGWIKWLGKMSDCPPDAADAKRIDCTNRLITPGLIDCHTHLVYAGNRANEFEQRLSGVDYASIAAAGGGIQATVTATRQASEQELFEQSLPRLKQIASEGVTTLEIKSGYGLDQHNEIKMLRVAQALQRETGLQIQKTLLAAHATPPEYKNRSDDYIDLICEEILPAAHAEGLVDAVDAFIEPFAFSVEQVEKLFKAAETLQLPVKLHTEQLSSSGGARMAASHGALSVDHLEYLDPADVSDLRLNKTTAVLLPGAFYTLNESRLPPIEALRQHQVPIALATDCNPGSSPLTSLLLTMNMACTLFKMTPLETLSGVTIHAARALGLDSRTGSLEAGKRADLVIWDISSVAELSYRMGMNPCAGIMAGGEWKH